MEIKYTKQAESDLLFWSKSGNKAVQKKITSIINSILETPFEGIGKPEPLKYELAGKWSRRINKEHRLVYEVIEDDIIITTILSAKGHYD